MASFLFGFHFVLSILLSPASPYSGAASFGGTTCLSRMPKSWTSTHQHHPVLKPKQQAPLLFGFSHADLPERLSLGPASRTPACGSMWSNATRPCPAITTPGVPATRARLPRTGQVPLRSPFVLFAASLDIPFGFLECPVTHETLRWLGLAEQAGRPISAQSLPKHHMDRQPDEQEKRDQAKSAAFVVWPRQVVFDFMSRRQCNGIDTPDSPVSIETSAVSHRSNILTLRRLPLRNPTVGAGDVNSGDREDRA